MESVEYQDQLRGFDDSLERDGFNPSSTVEFIEAVGDDVSPYLGVFKVALSGSLAALNVALGAWLKGQYGRAVELEIDGTKAKASTIEEVQALIEIAQEYRELNEPKRIIP